MKKVFLVLLVIFTISCKKNKEIKVDTNDPIINSKKIEEPIKKEEVFLSESKIPEYSNWVNNGIQITKSSEIFNGASAILMSRENATKSAYTGMNNLKVEYGSTYKTSVVVKKGTIGKDFALRIQGVYPNRVDVIFDLETGIAKEPKISGDDELVENAKVTIESLGNGWYICSLYADIYAKYIRIVLGPTKGNLNTTLWETRTGEKSTVLVVPSTLKLQEL